MLSAHTNLVRLTLSRMSVHNLVSDTFVCVQLLMFGPNQHFGEKALLSADYKYRANAVAKGHVTVLCASREDFTMVCNLSS